MGFWSAALLVVAGIAAGLTGSIAGLASLFSYPALLAVGLGPVSANVTNTVALVFNSIGSVTGSRPELRGRGDRVRRFGIVGVIGGGIGGLLLLITSSHAFERIVPVLIAAASVAILITPRPRPRPDGPRRGDSVPVLIGVGLIGVYGGYFGAAAGVLLLALLLTATAESLPRCNAVKNVTLGLANLVAAVLFAVFGTVDWAAMVPLAIGLFIGGRTGPIIVRHSPARLLRTAIGIAGIGLAIYLGIDAYR